MAIPDYQTIMLPLLKFAADGKEHSLREAYSTMSDVFNLSEEERTRLLMSGRKPIIDDRVAWARTFLGQARLLDSTGRGVFRISERGLTLLAENPPVVNDNLLKRYQEFIDFLNRKKKKSNDTTQTEIVPVDSEETLKTPEESLESAYQSLRDNLSTEILESIKSCSPSFFERLVVELLVKMGYGGTLQDAGQAIGRSGDEGVDGIIKEDRLGLDVIYLQAKRWDNTVSRPEIQKFAGALQGKRSKKGVFITTSDYSKEAREFASNIENKIILIDGNELADLMIDYNVGVAVAVNYEIKRIDSDYFLEE